MIIEKILVVGPAWVGDMIMAQVLFKSIKHLSPDVTIDVLAPDWTRALLDRMPEVNEAIAMPVGHGQLLLSERYHIARTLAAKHYQQAIILPNSLKSALIPWFAKIPKRTGWKGEMRYGLLNDMRHLDKIALPLMIQRFAALAYPKDSPLPNKLPMPRLVVSAESQQAMLTKFSLTLDKPVLALCPGAEFGPAKKWPEMHYAAVAQYYIQQGWQIWLFGSVKDQQTTGRIAEACSAACVDLAGKTQLAEAIDLLSLATRVLTNDSGLMHIASAVGRPLAAVYGSTSPEFTPPLAHRSEIVRTGIQCSPCFKRECPLEHLDCLNKLEPQLVIEALERLPAR